MKIDLGQALELLEQNGKPSLFRIMLQPVQPTLKIMVPEPAPAPTTPEPAPVEETPRPSVIVPPVVLPRYEFHTVTVLKKWWRALTCRHCKTDPVGFTQPR